MNVGVISSRYAKALLEYAVEQGAEDEVYACVLQLMHTLREVRDFSILLRAPLLTSRERVELICSAVAPSEVFRRFATLVVREEREELLLFISNAYITLYRKAKGVCAVKLVTAVPVTDAFKENLEKLLKAKPCNAVEIENVVDEAIIGGFLLETDSQRLDASVKGQMERIKKLLIKPNRKLV